MELDEEAQTNTLKEQDWWMDFIQLYEDLKPNKRK
jgi:hypothetical protein